MRLSFILLSAGMFKETFDSLHEIAIKDQPDSIKAEYYFLMSRYYYDLADYANHTFYSPVYTNNGTRYIDPAITLFPANTHINPYTKLTYKDDPDIIITELNNEPHHSGAKEKTTEYINRLAASVRSTGWTKPVFYNISESLLMPMPLPKQMLMGIAFNGILQILLPTAHSRGTFYQMQTSIIFRLPIPSLRLKTKQEWFMNLMQAIYCNQTCTRQ